MTRKSDNYEKKKAKNDKVIKLSVLNVKETIVLKNPNLLRSGLCMAPLMEDSSHNKVIPARRVNMFWFQW